MTRTDNLHLIRPFSISPKLKGKQVRLFLCGFVLLLIAADAQARDSIRGHMCLSDSSLQASVDKIGLPPTGVTSDLIFHDTPVDSYETRTVNLENRTFKKRLPFDVLLMSRTVNQDPDRTG